nr:MAG TPA: hypothetical protein [Caudoviricetes sp.]
MIFNPRRGGGEKEYKITARNNQITLSVTKQKPGHVFQATVGTTRQTAMEFTDPDTGKLVNVQGRKGETNYVMPSADVTILYIYT